MRSVLNRFRARSSELWRHWDNFKWESTTILAVTNNLAVRSSLRVLSLEQGWRILFADCLEDGLRLQRLNKVWILVYDRDLAGVEWRHGLSMLLTLQRAIFPIVLSHMPNCRLRSEVLRFGGYELARSPLDPKHFAALVNGALALARSIDSPEH
jgi:DNA-binding NtrC family response regulator